MGSLKAESGMKPNTTVIFIIHYLSNPVIIATLFLGDPKTSLHLTRREKRRSTRSNRYYVLPEQEMLPLLPLTARDPPRRLCLRLRRFRPRIQQDQECPKSRGAAAGRSALLPRRHPLSVMMSFISFSLQFQLIARNPTGKFLRLVDYSVWRYSFMYFYRYVLSNWA